MGEQSTGQADVMAWLLPSAPMAEEQHARRLVTFLRLLRDDARGQDAESVGVDLMRARRELARGDRARQLAALADLLRHYLHAALPRDSFVSFGEPRHGFQRAWDHCAGLDVPGPGESSLDVAARILQWAKGLGAGSTWLTVWRRRYAHVRLGFQGAKAGWMQLARQAERSGEAAIGAVAMVALVQGALDRRDLRMARRFLARGRPWIAGSAELRRCQLWVTLLGGDFEQAQRIVKGISPSGATLPLPLAELRAHLPAWSGVLLGVPRGLGLAPMLVGSGERRSLGASAFGLLRIDPGRGLLEPLAWDMASDLETRLPGYLRRRRGAWTRPGEPEHRALVLGRSVILHAQAGAPLALGIGARAKSLALLPLRDAAAEPFGWIHLEYEHHLLPSLAQLEALAESAARRLLAPHASCQGPPHGPPGSALPRGIAGTKPGAESASGRERVQAGQRLLERMPLPLRGRRSLWYCCATPGQPRLLASAGGGWLGAQPGIGRGLLRVLRRAAPLHFVSPAGLGCFGTAGSGILAPMCLGQRVLGVLVVEAERAGNFAAGEGQTLTSFVQGQLAVWRADRFSAWHLERYGERVDAPLGCGWWRGAAWEGLCSSAQPLSIAGEAHTGKRVLARWLHHEGLGPVRPFVELDCAAGRVSSKQLKDALERASDGTLCLAQPAHLSSYLQRELAHWFCRSAPVGSARSARPVRLLALLPEAAPLASGVAGMEPSLARLFEPLALCLPALRDRRDQIPRLVRCSLHDFAMGEGTDPVRLSDAAMGLLWRQPWPGNLRELRALLRRAALLHAGRDLGVAELQLLAKDLKQTLRRRLSTKRPRREDVQAALGQTRCANGRFNRTRAALYLGWDPDTLRRYLGC